jgi:D-lactate dehydrogenase
MADRYRRPQHLILSFQHSFIMKIAVFSTKPYDRQFLDADNTNHGFDIEYFEDRLSPLTARFAHGKDAVCIFVNDRADAETLEVLKQHGVHIVALRCAGFNNVDLVAAEKAGIAVVRVPAYSPYAVAEHAVALIMALNRKTHRAHNRIREGNFALEGLLGFDLHGNTVGLVGTGKIGVVFARIMYGFGCEVIGYDPFPSPEFTEAGGRYVSLDELMDRSRIISLHCPLTPDTYHMIDAKAIARMQKGVMLINTSRGALVDTRALIDGLKSGLVGHVGLDVYEEEADLFFEDLSDRVIQDDVFSRLTTFPNVMITGHQAFFTSTAMQNIASTTLENLHFLKEGMPGAHRVLPTKVRSQT